MELRLSMPTAQSSKKGRLLRSTRRFFPSGSCNHRYYFRLRLNDQSVRFITVNLFRRGDNVYCLHVAWGALNLQDLKMSDHKKTMTGNCNTWKMMDQIAALEFARPGK